MSIARATRLTFFISLLALSIASFFLSHQVQTHAQNQSANPVVLLTMDGTISPPAASYIDRGIHEAESIGASAVVIMLDTPGGLVDSTRDIVKSIANSRVPVILYVAPSGAQAASAGTYIGIGSHLLAMAPGTTIGSATPVQLGGEGDAGELPEDLRNKIINEAVSYIRAHAEIHGRNADWAERAVREGANLPASGAVEQNVAEFMANDLNDLLAQADGREVWMADGQTHTLRTANASIHEFEMGLVTRFLHAIADPNIAFILLSLAVLGIFFELANPGLFFPGVIGGVSLLLGFYALGTLNAFWGGTLLVVLAMVLLIAEVLTPTSGILGLGGIVALIVGGSLLFIDAPPGVQISPWTLYTVAGIAGVTVLFFSWAVLSTRRRHPNVTTGYGSMVGRSAVVRSPLTPEGYVWVHGERWRARLLDGENAAPGEEVVIERAEDGELWVRKQKGA